MKYVSKMTKWVQLGIQINDEFLLNIKEPLGHLLSSLKSFVSLKLSSQLNRKYIKNCI